MASFVFYIYIEIIIIKCVIIIVTIVINDNSNNHILHDIKKCADFILVQTVPTKPVEDVAASRVDGERVNISWTPLSLVEARGFPLYTVSYMSGGDQVESVSTNESNVIISGLSPRRTYTFTIRVSTGNGTGKTTSQGQFNLFVCGF